MRGTFEYKLDGSGDAINLNIDLDAVSANALTATSTGATS